MSRKVRKSYTREFKLDAIALVKEQGYSISQAAESLDVNSNVLRNWLNKYQKEPDQSFPGKGQLTPEQQRIRELEKQVRELQMEKEILKKASAFFAKEMK